jgi:hypothetical protein
MMAILEWNLLWADKYIYYCDNKEQSYNHWMLMKVTEEDRIIINQINHGVGFYWP